MQLIKTTPAPVKPPAVQVAESEITRLNDMLTQVVMFHRDRYTAFWDNPSATPDEILAALGSDAQTWLAAASESVGYLARLAALAGLLLSDLLPPEYCVPRRPFLPGPGGTLTLAPAEPPPDPLPDPPAETALAPAP